VRHLRQLPTAGVEIVSREENAGRGRLVIRERGVETGPRQPVFLGEFDRETEVEWDLETHLLQGLKRWVLVDGERRLFAESIRVEYPASIPAGTFRVELADDVRWGGVREAPFELLELGPREAALAMFEAARDGRRESVEALCPSPSAVDYLLDEQSRPTQILFVGEPFRAGSYPGVYVPYRVRFGSELRDHRLALRNDNPQSRWVFDGGL
jgi:hypothetical protein